RRGVAPYVERQKVTAVRVYDRRLRWPVPTDLPHRLVGRTVDRIDRRSKYLLFRLGADTLIVHMGMTGSLRVFVEPPPKQAHDHVELEFADAVVSGLVGAAPAASQARCRTVLRPVRRRLSVPGDAPSPRRDQACAHG